MQTALTCLKAVADAYGLPFDPAAAADRLGLGAAEPDLDALLAYLALRPAGATPAQVGDAFGITAGRVRKISHRRWQASKWRRR